MRRGGTSRLRRRLRGSGMSIARTQVKGTAGRWGDAVCGHGFRKSIRHPVRRPFSAGWLIMASLFAVIWGGAVISPSAVAANKCIQYPSHDAYMCVVLSIYGALYWYDALYTR